MEDRTPRKRVANFTPEEKALLTLLIKRRPIIDSKFTDGKSVAKKRKAWSQIADEFNSNAREHQRDIQTLKRAWDNLKALARKARATESGNLTKTDSGPHYPTPPSQNGAFIKVEDEEGTPGMFCDIKNTFDNDGTSLPSVDDNKMNCIEPLVILKHESSPHCETNDLSSTENAGDDVCDDDLIETTPLNPRKRKGSEQRKLSDYVRREGVLRIKHFELKKKIELQILQAKLENQNIKRKTAEMEQEIAKTLLEKAKLELEDFKLRLSKKE